MNKLLLTGIILLYLACNTKQKAVALITVSSDSVNIGLVKKDSIVNASMMLYSTGTDTLHIINIGADCGCTKT